jgi:SAM-dependent methyltransferase
MLGKIFRRIRSAFYRIIYFYKAFGLFGLISRITFFVMPTKKIKNLDVYVNHLKDKYVLEIGGPSKIFEKNNILELYPSLGGFDLCNIVKTSENIKYICDALDLKQIPSQEYDAVLSSHTIEHIANPLKALNEWKRVLKDDGLMLLVVPHKDGTVDHKRPLTTIKHLISDFDNSIGEGDKTHLEEVLELTDGRLDPGYLGYKSLKEKVERNYEGRHVHLHTYNVSLMAEMFDYLNLEIISAEAVLPFHIIIMGKKVVNGRANNRSFLNEDAKYKKEGPFKKREKVENGK